MSGPKRADVEAALLDANRSLQGCADAVRRSQSGAVAALLSETDEQLRGIGRSLNDARVSSRELSNDLKRLVPEAILSADTALTEAELQAEAAKILLECSRGALERAREHDAEASSRLALADQEYRAAHAALSAAGDHYLRGEMEKAERAKGHASEAASRFEEAEIWRRKAEGDARAALQLATEALAAAESAKGRVEATKAEAEARKRAEDESRRIAEQKRREAVLNVDLSRSAVVRIESLPHAKFRPGELEVLRSALADADALIARGAFEDAVTAARRIAAAVPALERAILDAAQDFERRRAEAQAQETGLKAAINSVDQALVRSWANDSEALRDAQSALLETARAITNEDFEQAAQLAMNSRERLTAAVKDAAEAQAANTRREHIGEAVMEALNDLGFDVSFEAGTRTDPLRISGQTPTENGQGDFDIAIPLSGDVGFHLDTPEGDAACVAAVDALQKRLAARGISWQTTDWGHGKHVRKSMSPASLKEKEVIQQKTKYK